MNFNLTTDPWIPVRWLDGRSTSVSLHQLFAESSRLADLAVPPHERISLLRLLICITQATLGAPATSDDWPGWGDDLETTTAAYLTKWNEHFNLMGDGPRFLQVKVAETQQKPLFEFLEFKMKSNDTVFNHEGGTTQHHENSWVALKLLTFQNFFLPGATGSPAIGGIKGSGPAINYLHAFLSGRNLKETIVLNCLDLETIGESFPTHQMGRPVWELFSNETSFAKISNVAGESYLGRLLPTPSLVWLGPNTEYFFLKQGIQYPQFRDSGSRDASSTLIVSALSGTKHSPEPYLLRSDPSKSTWRVVHSVVVVGNAGTSCGPLILRSHISDPLFLAGECGLWCGELVRSKDSKGMPTAKLETLIESHFPAPKELFSVAGQKRYEGGVVFSNRYESILSQAIKSYVDQLRPKPSKPSKIESADYSCIPSAKRHFWNTLDQRSSILLSLLKNLGTAEDPMGAAEFGKGNDPWTLAVRAAATAAYEATCPRQNPRHYQAYAAGLRVLWPTAKKSTAKKTPAKIHS
jgi:CRISPR system Cascade subunit CasA